MGLLARLSLSKPYSHIQFRSALQSISCMTHRQDRLAQVPCVHLWPSHESRASSALHAHRLKQAREVEARGCQLAAHDAPPGRIKRRLHRLFCVQVCACCLHKQGALSALHVACSLCVGRSDTAAELPLSLKRDASWAACGLE